MGTVGMGTKFVPVQLSSMQHADSIFTGNFFPATVVTNVENVSETEYYYAYRKTSDRSFCLLLEHFTPDLYFLRPGYYLQPRKPRLVTSSSVLSILF